MSYSKYKEAAQTALFENLDAFFAFSNSQLEDNLSRLSRKKSEMVSLGQGLICPKENATAVFKGLENIEAKSRQLRLVESTPDQIITEEMANYECQITGDYSEVKKRLEDYGFSDALYEKCWRDFYKKCIDEELF